MVVRGRRRRIALHLVVVVVRLRVVCIDGATSGRRIGARIICRGAQHPSVVCEGLFALFDAPLGVEVAADEEEEDDEEEGGDDAVAHC